jgi:phosphatidylglycerol lysyltransferase
MTVEHPERGVVAFVNLVRDGAPSEATFDLMRHRADAPSGSMDLLIVRLIQQLRLAGVANLSLGMAPWSEVGSEPGARLLERGVGALTPRLERFFSVSGLRAYKEKFHPAWEARYLVYGSETVLPRVALAVVRLTEQGAHLDDDDDFGALPDARHRHALPPLAPSAV